MKPRPLAGILIALVAALATLAPARLSALDASWKTYEAGRKAFDEGRLGEALHLWQQSMEDRKRRFSQAAAWVETAMALPQASRARDSVLALAEALALEEMQSRLLEGIREEARGSYRGELEVLRSKIESKPLGDLLSAALMAVDARGADSFHDSLKALLALCRSLVDYPEAEFGIGRVFEAEGELKLAELQYSRAIAESAALEVPELRYEILDALARAQRMRGDWKAYEATLRLSLEGSSIFGDKGTFTRTAMERALSREGFDTFVGLYRVEETRIIGPASALGEFLLKRGRSQAITHLAIASDAMITRIIDRIREVEPSFRYRDLPSLALRIEAEPELRAWAAESGLFRCLYYLGEALLEESQRVAARNLLKALSLSRGAGAWGRAASLALERPEDSPALIP